MSRVCVKGLPRRLDEKELRKLFSFASEVTDAKVIRDKDGKSRQFAFVGFRSDTDAALACKKLNGTYVGTSRVQVEIARPAGDPGLARPWSRHSKGSSAHTKRLEREEREEVEKFRAQTRARAKEVAKRKKAEEKAARQQSRISEKDREGFDAFKSVLQKRGRTPMWADGQPTENAKADTPNPKATGASVESDGSSDEDDEEYQEIPALKEEKPETEKKNLKPNPVALDEGVSDADYFKSKIAAIDDDDDDDDNSDDDNDDGHEEEKDDDKEEEANTKDDETRNEEKGTKNPEVGKANSNNETDEGKGKTNGDALSNKNSETKKSSETASEEQKPVDAGDTGRLFVRNLAFSVNEDDLENLFEKYGTLSEVHIIMDSATKRSRGVAFVSFVVPENAATAMVALDNTVFCGRLLHILPGRSKRVNTRSGRSGLGDGVGMNSFKQGREDARVDAARSGLDGQAQNTMFLGADAVAATMASRLGVSKSELLGTERGESGNAAVRVAVAEATIQAETKQFLKENGIDLEKVDAAKANMNAKTAAGKRARLTRKAFLVKNLPSGTKEYQLDQIFSKFGTLNRLALAPSSLLALVEFSMAGEAKRAYAGCAYKRFRDVPLYLEWLPADCISQSTPREQTKESESPAEPEIIPESTKPATETIAPKTETGPIVNASSVYVKNLNFATTEENLKMHLQYVLKKRKDVMSGLRTVSIATKNKVDEKTGSSTKLSSGFGFAEFASRELAMEAVKIAQGSILDGHKLELRVSNRVAEPKNKRKRKSEKRKPSAKIMVRNIAFEASVREVRELFASFAQIKSVRLPRKMDGSHRGFGFLEFVSVNEAKTAMNALADAHLYGRHLVIEYADEDASGINSMDKLLENAMREANKNKRRKIENGERGDDDGNDRIRDELYT